MPLDLKWASSRQHIVGSYVFVQAANLCTSIVEHKQYTCKEITNKEGISSVIVLFVFYMLYSFLSLISIITVFCVQLIFVVKYLIALIYFCIHSIAIFFVISIEIKFSILKLQHSNLNLYQLNFNNMKNCSYKADLSLSLVHATKLHLYILHAPKHKLIIILNALVSSIM